MLVSFIKLRKIDYCMVAVGTAETDLHHFY